MPQYTFKISELENRTVDALRKAGISKYDPYELVEGYDFENKCFMAVITDEILFGE